MEMCNIYHSHSNYLPWLQTDDWVEFYFVSFEMFTCSTFLKLFSMAPCRYLTILILGLIDLII